MDDSSEDKGLVIFGRDVSKIPCFRNSFLYGIMSGIGCGLTVFLFTSRPRTATNCAMAGFTVVTMGYWTQCRYNYSKIKFEMDSLKYGLQQHMLHEGVNDDDDESSDNSPSVVDV